MKRIFVLAFLVFFTSFTSAEKLNKEEGYLYIATFNVFKLGAVASKYTDSISTEQIPERITNLANVLAVGDFDLIALQEVAFGEGGERAVSDLINALKDKHGLEYRVVHSQHIGRGLMPEMISFLFDPNEVSPSQINNDSYTELIKIEGRDLVNSKWKAGHFDFNLISAHLAWGSEEDRIYGFKKIDDILKEPSDFATDPDIIILGDFNRFGDGQESVKFIEYSQDKVLAPNITIFDPAFNEKKSVKKKDIVGKGIPNDNPQLLSTTVAKNTYVYDAFIMTGDVIEEFDGSTTQPIYGVDFGILAFDEVGAFGYQQGAEKLKHNDLKVAFSDHRPLWMRFNVSKAANADETQIAEQNFYTTPHGKRYHEKSCSTIQHSHGLKEWSNIEALVSQGFQPCKVCLE
ncbi:MAG: hypothetical protein ABJH28_08440 [Paraglaciecola sp.]|uniref:hypothetical protein n=1 Tax=Paraglaciecola sp. TaxID=1920173 RepID=UPI003263F6FB